MEATCIHIACKQTENPRKLRDVVNVAYYVSHPDPDTSESSKRLLKIDAQFWTIKESLMKAELVVLRSLRFHTNVYLPHSYVPLILNELDQDMSTHSQWSVSDCRNLAQMSLAVASDSLCFSHIALDPVFLSGSSSTDDDAKDHAWNLALACLFCSLKILGMCLPDSFEKVRLFERHQHKILLNPLSGVNRGEQKTHQKRSGLSFRTY